MTQTPVPRPVRIHAREPAQHAACLVQVSRLAQRQVVDENERVRADHRGVRPQRRHGGGLEGGVVLAEQAPAASRASWISSAGDATTSKSTPARSNNSRRRGEDEASTMVMATAWRESPREARKTTSSVDRLNPSAPPIPQAAARVSLPASGRAQAPAGRRPAAHRPTRGSFQKRTRTGRGKFHRAGRG